MKPYYQTNTVTVYKSDFRAIVEKLSRDVLVVSDPPYNIGFKYDEYRDEMPDDDYIEMLCELQRFRRVVVCHYPVACGVSWIPVACIRRNGDATNCLTPKRLQPYPYDFLKDYAQRMR